MLCPPGTPPSNGFPILRWTQLGAISKVFAAEIPEQLHRLSTGELWLITLEHVDENRNPRWFLQFQDGSGERDREKRVVVPEAHLEEDGHRRWVLKNRQNVRDVLYQSI